MKTSQAKPLTITLPEYPKDQHAFVSGLVFILRAFPEEFSEALHKMYFPKEQGFSGNLDWHSGNIFQRSLIADTLLDCNAFMNNQLTPLIEHELEFLTHSVRTDGVGSWGYFPELIELAPDADDLAQMIQLYVRTGKYDSINEYCIHPLQVLLTDNAHEDGGLETWIIPKENRTEIQNIQIEWAEEAWGVGADPEVVANLIYSLMVLDKDQYKDTIHKGAQFLWSRQQENGSWNSTWYFGAYYGTYTALRVCLYQEHQKSQIAHIINFIEQSQMASGGWGNGVTANALQTSLALLCLNQIKQVYSDLIKEDIISSGIEYLKRTQQESGSWASCPFIKMEMGRPKGFVYKTLEYGSETITTIFAIKALHALNIQK